MIRNCNTTIYTFWYNPSLNNTPDEITRVSILSMLRWSKETIIYTYDQLNDVDELIEKGLIIKDANEFLSHDEWFTVDYGPLHGFAFISDVIRYKILQHQRGWWVDTDVILIDELDSLLYRPQIGVAYGFERYKSDGSLIFNGAILYSNGQSHKLISDALIECNRVIETKQDIDKWGIIGPVLLSKLAIVYNDDRTVELIEKNAFYFNQYFQNDLARWAYNPLCKSDAKLITHLYYMSDISCFHLWFSAVDWSLIHKDSLYSMIIENTKTDTIHELMKKLTDSAKIQL